MPAAEAWTGVSHRAAGAMFGRATDKASTFKHYTDAVAHALSAGAGAIGSARTALLSHADDIDRGELSVNDMWVVLIKPARVSAEKAASLQEQAKSEQAEINRLLSASARRTRSQPSMCNRPRRLSVSLCRGLTTPPTRPHLRVCSAR